MTIEVLLFAIVFQLWGWTDWSKVAAVIAAGTVLLRFLPIGR